MAASALQRSSANLIENTSGEKNYNGWEITKKGGEGWTIEKEPIGCAPVPKDEFLGVTPERSESCCFATSFGWSAKSYLINLERELSAVKDAPLEIRCGQMYMTRFDCGGKFRWNLRLLDSSKALLSEHKWECELAQEANVKTPWKRVTHVFKVNEGSNLVGKIRFLNFTHEGVDNKSWAGHYGIKFARSTVVIFGVPRSREEREREDRSREIVATEEPVTMPDNPGQLTSHAEGAVAATSHHHRQPSPLECPVCLDIPRNQKVFQCRNGHLICETCLAQVQHCPQCRVSMSTENAIRNRAMESVIEAMTQY